MENENDRPNNKPSPEDIIAALSESGYLMEQRVATSLEENGFNVRTNRAYEDIEEAKSREIDVTAIKTWYTSEQEKVALAIELVIECKNYKLPVVTITRRKNEADRREAPKEHLFPFSEYLFPVPGKDNTVYQKHPYFAFQLDKVDPLFLEESKAVQFCRIDGHRKKWEANHSGMHESILLPVMKAADARRREIAGFKGKDWSHIWLCYSLVVLSNDLFVVDSHDPSKASPIDWSTLIRDNKSSTLTGRYAIHFVREEKIQDFVTTNILPVADHLKRLIIENPKQFKDQFFRS